MECVVHVLTTFIEEINVTQVSSVDDAIKASAGVQHDLLICDHCEAINGLDFIRKFRLTQPQTPIFVASENLDPRFVSDVSEYGIAGFFPKPVRLDNFSRRVKKTLAAGQAMEGKFRPQQTRFPFVRAHPDRLFPLYQFDRSEKAVELGEQICQVANFEPTLFIEGPNGSEFKIMAASILGAGAAEEDSLHYVNGADVTAKDIISWESFKRTENDCPHTIIVEDAHELNREQVNGILHALTRQERKTSSEWGFRLLLCAVNNNKSEEGEESLCNLIIERTHAQRIRIPALKERAYDLIFLLNEVIMPEFTDQKNPVFFFLNEAALKFVRIYEWPGNYAEMREAFRSLLESEPGKPLSDRNIIRVLKNLSTSPRQVTSSSPLKVNGFARAFASCCKGAGRVHFRRPTGSYKSEGTTDRIRNLLKVMALRKTAVFSTKQGESS